MEGFDYKKMEMLLQRNLDYTKKVYENTEKIRKYIMWIRILNILKLVVIVLPIVLAIIFLPPLIKEMVQSYSGVFDQVDSLQSGNVQNIDVDVLKNLLK
ncbi:hypothetical protein COT97_02020 [Candidatus Falkowbacteria bacterium CG10_big_fil_rev_8_21_14_0_10_39_11]|uniref:Uncharacterized protein n=1 Tax=Candidatus Falkowbacteria bacterium CG10_big_fil_rev_8_21_14_0_10_39_11 TaxID=1974565 RepID=A0A2H0V564_9BACT|nr:MAG: hypothetical protein COT97_02020 [Candidatus Falkowbacteria bacterium CG10_big_fil_rev_8_21_14_0_10_39_11]